jgi:hypothetical protein
MLADSQRAQDELRAYSRQLERELGALMKAIAELAGNQ